MRALDQVANYIEGLKPATWMEVAYQAPDTLDVAVQHAIKYDTAMFGLGRPFARGNKPSHKSYPSKTPTNNSGAGLMEIDQAEAARNKGKGKFKGNCYKCGLQGHIAKNCRVKNKQNLTNVEDTNQPHPVTNNSLELTHIDENRERLLRFNGKVNGHYV